MSISLNNATGLARTLTSLFGPHTSDQVEVIVVDGGSWDDTAEVLHRFANPRLRVVSEPDRGVYDAMNKGPLLTTGDYIMWLNAGDTLVSNRSLTRLEEILDSAPTWAIVGARHMRAEVRADHSNTQTFLMSGGGMRWAANHTVIRPASFPGLWLTFSEATPRHMGSSVTSTSSCELAWSSHL